MTDVFEERIFIVEEFPDFLKVFPVYLLSVAGIYHHHRSRIELEVFYKMFVAIFFDINSMPFQAAIPQGFSKTGLYCLVRVSLDFPARRTTGPSMEVVGYDLM